eukprot:CAMPEP_0117601974 /NCGR_PEP_ID=MMETSP0784-20121206/77324_1 /TAXON_ID=39447 /ORGANISM="" /LENGTH=441 /DNA_ID=CAMNT_0005404743 /DNA_START=118 /DNA_END=1443 /DNA_ORIENTATION=-
MASRLVACIVCLELVASRRLWTMERSGRDASSSAEQLVHWVFTTDCSAYMFNQGNLMLASADYVKQPGEFTWIVNGCDRPSQKAALTKLAHPTAKVWFAPKLNLTDPTTGETYRDFQASNRPLSIAAWWREVQPEAEAIGILDPDMTWLRPVRFLEQPVRSKSDLGPWETFSALHKRGSGAMYGQGCIPHSFSDAAMLEICQKGSADKCIQLKQDYNACRASYSSGPPWVLHKSDADEVFDSWTGTAVKVHKTWPDMLAEQVSYGVAQMQFGIDNVLDPFWFLSATNAGEQPWDAIARAHYDPCQERSPPSIDLGMPPLWHACSSYDIPHLQGFRLHKDHIHKDLLDCGAPLLHYPPRDALQRYAGDKHSKAFRDTWSVCTYTNLVNFHAAAWKAKYCDKPNLEANFAYPPHAQSFLNKSSWLEHVFRKGGWTDVDYKVGV